MRSRLVSLAAAGALLGACSYEYTNPAEALDSGEITGRVLADTGSGSLSGVAGVQVTLRHSQNSVATKSTGRFFLYGLMPGRHTVIFGDGATLALRRDVDMVWGRDGQPEGVVLGDLVLRQAVTLKGSVLPAVIPVDKYSFLATSAAVVDEETGQSFGYTPNGDGSFDFSITGAPAGRHRIRVAVTGTYCDYVNGCLGSTMTLVAGPILLDIPESGEGLQHQLNDLTPVQETLPGKLRFKVAVSGASWSGGFDVTVVPDPGFTPTPDSTGTYELDLSPGLYSLSLAMPAGYVGSLQPPASVDAVVAGDETTELGTIYFVDSGAISKGDNGCLTTADCYSMEVCSNGQCVFHEPMGQACIAGDFTSVCSNAQYECSTYLTPTPCASGAGVCGQAPDSSYTCVPNGQPTCLWNGTQPVPAICGQPT